MSSKLSVARLAFRFTAIAAVCAVFLLPAVQLAGQESGQGDDAAAPGATSDEDTSGEGAVADGSRPGALTIPTKSLASIIKEGGMLMAPLLLCSFILLVFVFERSISLRIGRIVPGPFVRRFLHQLEEGQFDRDQALLVCEENGSPIARVFTAAVKRWGKPASEIDQAINDAGQRVVSELRRYLRVFNGIATVSPLLGLLGTVFGMIRAFNDIASSDAMGRPELLAAGISEALLTTAMGLAVAIPGMLLYWYFVSRVDRLTVRIDALGQEVVAVISAEAIAETTQTKRSSRSKTAA